MKTITIIVAAFFLFTISAFSQDTKMPPTAPGLLVFPDGLIKYLPDSVAKIWPKIVEDAMNKGLPSEYLYSFLPDSIARLLPEHIDDFIPKPPQVSTGNPFTAENLMSLFRIGDIRLSPDGTWILYTLSQANIPANRYYKSIYAVSIDGNNYKRITDHPSSNYSGIWFPGGKKIAFLSSRNLNIPQIFITDFPTGEQKALTSLPEGVANLSLSPNGKYFSFTSDVKLEPSVTDLYPNYPKINMKIYDKTPIRHWDEWTDEKFSHLFIMPVDGGEPKDLLDREKFDTPLKPFGGGEQIAWSPDSKEIAYTCKKVDNFVESTNSDIYIVDLATGKTKNITDGMQGYDMNPLYSPDGKWIAFNSQERAGFESDKIRLMLYDRKTGQITELSKTIDRWVEEFLWSPDSKSLYFTSGDSGTVKIFNIQVKDGSWKIIADGLYNYGHGLDITKSGKTLIFGKQDFLRPLEIYSMPSVGGEQHQLTRYNEGNFANIKPVNVKSRTFTSTDGKKFQCWLIFPPDFDSTKKYPMITYCQGGPQSMVSPNFHYRWNLYLLASHGYVVMAANRRGVPGFGQDWNDAISKDWSGKPMQDFLSATDAMAKEPYIDKDGLAAMGASAGGYAVFWFAGNHNKRFKAFVSHSGVFNFESMYGATEELWFPNWEYGGPYWDMNNKALYDKQSPHRYARNWDTPIFISAGELDFRVPYTQSLEAFQVAQVKHIPSELIIFPEQTHFIFLPQEFIVWDKEVFNFLDKYCKKK